MHRGKVLFCCALVAMGGVVSAGESAASGGSVSASGNTVPKVLTPARLRQPREEVPASVTVIDRDLIRASGAREIWELFRLVPGMSAEKVQGNIPTVAYHATQARSTRRMQVLVDGRTQQRPGLARVMWNDMPLSIEDVERIEITRGPNSALYGANAMTGVINIITRHPRDVTGVEMERRRGNNGVRDARGTVAAQSGPGALRMTVERRGDDGYEGPEDMDYPDAKKVESLNLRYSHDLSPRDELEFFAGVSRTSIEVPPSDSIEAFATQTREQQTLSDEQFAQFKWQRLFSPAHSLSVQLYGQRANAERSMGLCIRDPASGEPGPGGGVFFSGEMRDLYEENDRDLQATMQALQQALQDDDSPLYERHDELTGSGLDPFCGDFLVDVVEERLDLEIQDTVHLSEYARLVTGLNLRHDRAESLAYASGAASNTSRRAFANLELSPGEPLRVNLGGYWEHHDTNDSFFSPRAAVTMIPAPGHGVRMVWSEAVRALDLVETDGDTTIRLQNIPDDFASDPDLLGQPHPDFFITQTISGGLKPERIKSRELGYFGRFGGLELDLRFYHESLRDLVVSRMSLFDLEAHNDSWVHHQGWEGELGWHLSPRHYVRGTLMRNRLENRRNAEGRFAPEESNSLLWRYEVTRSLQLSGTWHRATDYNEFRYERLGAHLSWRYPLGGTELVLRGAIEHDRADEPVVFEENVRGERNRFWLSASLGLW